MSDRDVALAYISAFCSGDLGQLGKTLHAQFSLRGPLYSFDSKQAYLASLERDPPEPGSFRIIEVLEGDGTVAVFYDYEKARECLTIAQLFWFEGGKISTTLLVF